MRWPTDAVGNADLAEATHERRHSLRRSAGRWALAAGACLIVAVAGFDIAGAVPSIDPVIIWINLAAVLGLLVSSIAAIVDLIRSGFATAAPGAS